MLNKINVYIGIFRIFVFVVLGTKFANAHHPLLCDNAGTS